MTGNKLSYELTIWRWRNVMTIYVFRMYQRQRYGLPIIIGKDGANSTSWRTTSYSIEAVPLETLQQQIYDY